MPAVKSRPQKHLCAPLGKYTYEDAYYREAFPGQDINTYAGYWVEACIARIEADNSGVAHVSLVPTFTESMEAGQPRRVLAREKRFGKIVTHLKWASEGLPGAPAFKVRSNEIQIYDRT